MQLPWQAELQIAPLWISHLRFLLFMLCISILIFILFSLYLKVGAGSALIKQMSIPCEETAEKQRAQLVAKLEMYGFIYFVKSVCTSRLQWAQSEPGHLTVFEALCFPFNFQVSAARFQIDFDCLCSPNSNSVAGAVSCGFAVDNDR